MAQKTETQTEAKAKPETKAAPEIKPAPEKPVTTQEKPDITQETQVKVPDASITATEQAN